MSTGLLSFGATSTAVAVEWTMKEPLGGIDWLLCERELNGWLSKRRRYLQENARM